MCDLTHVVRTCPLRFEIKAISHKALATLNTGALAIFLAKITFMHMPAIYVWVFTHKSKMRLPEGGVRVDKLCSEIAKELNGSRYYGLGELDLYAVKRFAPMTDYQGKVMTFMATDFNRLSPTGKPIPTNRKRGE